MVFSCIIILTLTLLFTVAAPAAEEKGAGPADPVTPSADFVNREGDGRSWVRAALVRGRGERLEGELSVSFAALNLAVAGTDGSKIRAVPVAEITVIEFVRWQGRKRRTNEYAFYPVRIRVTLADRTVIESGINTRALYRLPLRTAGRTLTLYSYFFDYREKDTWKHTGGKEMAYPETNPHGDTVVRIEFKHEAETNPLEFLLKKLSR